MIALRKFTTINNNQIILNMPNDFSENEEVEVIYPSKTKLANKIVHKIVRYG